MNSPLSRPVPSADQTLSAPLLEIRDLAVSFGATLAVKQVSLTLQRGETLALVGESGSGKSVSALSILQLLPYPQRRRIVRRGSGPAAGNSRSSDRDGVSGADDLAQSAAFD